MKKWVILFVIWIGIIATPIILLSKSFVLPAIPSNSPIIALLFLFPVLLLLIAKVLKKEKTFLVVFLLCSVISLAYMMFSIFGFDSGITWLYPMGSKTNSAENYLVIDKNDLYAVEEDKLFSVFPKEIPNNATDVKYEYSYFFDMFILAQWTLPQEDFYAEKRRIASVYTHSLNSDFESNKYSFDVIGTNKLNVEFDESTYNVKYEFIQVDFANQG